MARRSQVVAKVAAHERIGKPFRMAWVPIDQISHNGNVREDNLECDGQLIALMRSLVINGWLDTQIPILNERTDGTLEAVTCNRRINTIRVCKDAATLVAFMTAKGYNTDERKGLWKDIRLALESKPLGIDKLYCKVYEGLTVHEENVLRADHVGTKKLNRWEQFVQARQLFEAGHFDDSVAAATGISKGKAMKYKYRLRLGKVAIDDLYNQTHNPDYKPLLDEETLNKVHSAWLNDVTSYRTSILAGVAKPEEYILPDSERSDNKMEWAEYRAFGTLTPSAQAIVDGLTNQLPAERRIVRPAKDWDDYRTRFSDADIASAWATFGAGYNPKDSQGNLLSPDDLYRLEIELRRLLGDLKAERENLLDQIATLTLRVTELEEINRDNLAYIADLKSQLANRTIDVSAKPAALEYRPAEMANNDTNVYE